MSESESEPNYGELITADALIEELSLYVDPGTLVGAMNRAIRSYKLQQERLAWQQNTHRFMAAYEHTDTQEAGDEHSLPEWADVLTDATRALTKAAANKGMSTLGEQEQRVARAAATTYAYRLLQTNTIEAEGGEDALHQLLRRVGIEPRDLRDSFADVYRQHGPVDGQSLSDESFETFTSMARFWKGTPPVWNAIVVEAVAPVRYELTEGA